MGYFELGLPSSIPSTDIHCEPSYFRNEYGGGVSAESVLYPDGQDKSLTGVRGEHLRNFDKFTDAWYLARTGLHRAGLLPSRFYSPAERWFTENYGQDALKTTSAKEIEIQYIQNSFIPEPVIHGIREYDSQLADAMVADLRPIVQDLVYLPNRLRFLGAIDGSVTGFVSLMPSEQLSTDLITPDINQFLENLKSSNIDDILLSQVVISSFYSIFRSGSAEVMNDIRAIKDQFAKRAQLSTQELGDSGAPLPETLISDLFNLQVQLISNKFTVTLARGNSGGMIAGGIAAGLQHPELKDKLIAIASVLAFSSQVVQIWKQEYKNNITPNYSPFQQVDAEIKDESAKVARVQSATGAYEANESKLDQLRKARSILTYNLNAQTQKADQIVTRIFPLLAGAFGIGAVSSVPGLLLFITKFIGPISSAYFAGATTAQQQIMIQDLGNRLRQNMEQLSKPPYYRPLKENEAVENSPARLYDSEGLDLLRIAIPYQGSDIKVLQADEPVVVRGGEICLLDGGNFQGKTTLLRMMTGGIRGVLEDTDTGLFGKPLQEVGRQERRQQVLGLKAGEVKPQELRAMVLELKKRYNHKLLSKYTLDELVEWDKSTTVSLIGRDLAAEFAQFGLHISEERLFSDTKLSGSEGTLARLIVALGIEDQCVIAADELLSPMTPENRRETLRMLDNLPENLIMMLSSNDASKDLFFHPRVSARINVRDLKIRKRRSSKIPGNVREVVQEVPFNIPTVISSSLLETELDGLEKQLAGTVYEQACVTLIEQRRFEISQTYR